MAFTGVTNVHGPSPQPTATGSNQAYSKVLNYLALELNEFTTCFIDYNYWSFLVLKHNE